MYVFREYCLHVIVHSVSVEGIIERIIYICYYCYVGSQISMAHTPDCFQVSVIGWSFRSSVGLIFAWKFLLSGPEKVSKFCREKPGGILCV